MQTGRATGSQIAFLTFALLLLAVPLSRWLGGLLPWSEAERLLIEKAVPFLVAGALLLGIAPLRRWARGELRRPVAEGRRTEVFAVAGLSPLIAFAGVGFLVLLWWLHEGEPGLARHVSGIRSDDWHMAQVMLPADLVRALLIGALLGPLLEELIFRGLLFRAWERQWGWLAAMLLSALVFALYHDLAWHAFLIGVVNVCLYRRTGTLWAPIAAHAFYNFSMWYPLLGRHVFQRYIDAPGDLGQWTFHLACLAVAAVAIPAYAWMSRDAALEAPRPSRREPANEPLPQ